MKLQGQKCFKSVLFSSSGKVCSRLNTSEPVLYINSNKEIRKTAETVLYFIRAHT